MARTVHRGAVVTAALALLAGCATPTTPADTPAASETTATESATEEPSEEPTEEPEESATVLVYYLTDTRSGFRLAREPLAVTGDPAVAAVEAMIAGPADPDLATTWDPATEVRSVGLVAGVLTVDLSDAARTANSGSEAAALMLQQLVWTVTGAIGDPAAPVALTIDGETPGDLWGVVSVTEPLVRQDGLEVLSFVQIDSLAEGAETTSPVTVAGEAAAFEATLGWRVLDGAGDTVAEGSAMTAEGQTFAPYSFEVPLDPGTWTVVVEETDPSDGEGGPVTSVTRTVTVG